MKFEQQIKDRIYNAYLVVSRRLSESQMMAILAVVVGLCAGIGAYVFNTLLHFISHSLTSWTPDDQAQWLYLIYPAIGIILATLFVKYVVKDGISEGVTRVLYAMSRNNSRIRGHNTWTSIVGGATTIGFGGSVGPEAPIVLTGAAIGSNVGKLARLNYKNITLMLCCGAGAAVAAIFKAPITGVIFVLEILMLDITSKSIIPLLLASMTATITSLVLHGFSPIISISLSSSDMFQVEQVPLFLLLGCFCGVMAFYFTSVNSKVGGFYNSIQQQWRKWLYAGISLGVLIFIFPPLYGEGHDSFGALMMGNTDSLFNHTLFHSLSSTDWFLIVYLIAIMLFKVVAMATTNAAGGVGGTFAPSLFVGAFAGATRRYMSDGIRLGCIYHVIYTCRHGGCDVWSDEGSTHSHLSYRRAIKRLRTLHPANDRVVHIFRRELRSRPRLYLHQTATHAWRAPHSRQGLFCLRIPASRPAYGDRLYTHPRVVDIG